MKLLFLNHLENARDSLRANRMRTFLTITGVAIGIASIIAILSLATGASQIVANQVDETGGTIAVIRPGVQTADSISTIVNQQAHGSITTSSLTLSDVAHIKTLPAVTSVAPIIVLHANIASAEHTLKQGTVVGSSDSLLTMSNVRVASGSFDTSNENIVTIGTQLSVNLFGTENSLGKTLTIRGKEFRVGGVLERQHNPMNFNGFDFNTITLLNQEQLLAISPTAQVQQINVQVDSIANLEPTVVRLNKDILARHNNEQDFSVLVGDAIAEPTSQLFFVIAGVTATIAGISLFVGGIGIMNIMLVNVAERTREIGIRKALGATHSDIIWQFLIESLLMSLIGGIVGGFGGMALAFIISLFLTFDPVITWHAAAIAVGTAAVIGVIFGLYPALRASRKDPIESLKQQN